MGVLGVYLIFVGIVLVLNGLSRFYNWDAKTTAFMNAITGGIIVIGSLINFAKNGFDDTSGYLNVAAGFLFGITYIFIAANNLFKLDWRPFGWFSLFVTVFALYMAVLFGIEGVRDGRTSDWLFVYLWTAWALLWLNGFLDIVAKMKSMSKIFPYLSIAEGIFAAFIPALLMLTNYWPVA